MRRTEQFRKQHEGIVSLVQEMSKKLDAESVTANPQDVRLKLSKLAGLVKVHLAMEDKGLYPSLMSSLDPKLQSTVQRFIDEMGGIYQAFVEYNDKWTAKAMREQADLFVRETKNLFGVLGKRIERENNELYPIVDSLK